MHKENIYTVPNFLSGYRILTIPFIIWTLLDKNRDSFILLISINLITDILDGYIARKFKLVTKFGAKLDSLADIGTFLLAICGFFIFEYEFLFTHKFAFISLIGLYIIGQIYSLLKFKTNTSFHLYSNKISGYLQGIFIFTFFNFGYCNVLFYLMIIWGCLAELEVIAMVFKLKKSVSDVKTIFLYNFNQ